MKINIVTCLIILFVCFVNPSEIYWAKYKYYTAFIFNSVMEHAVVMTGSEMCAREAEAAKWAAKKLSCNCSALFWGVSF